MLWRFLQHAGNPKKRAAVILGLVVCTAIRLTMRQRMEEQTVALSADALGFSYPQPVSMTRKAIQGGGYPVEVLVEPVTSRENVRRAAEKLGCTVQVGETGDEFRLTLSKPRKQAVAGARWTTDDKP
jgi:tRNA 2-thiouridine synthesizing protein A